MANVGNLPQQFADYFLAQCAPEIGDRQLSAVPDNGFGTNYSVRVVFVNLPRGAGGAGGGAEHFNNRILFQVSGWSKDKYLSDFIVDVARKAKPKSGAEPATVKKKVTSADVAQMLDDLNDYHESNVAGVQMKVITEPSRDKYATYHLWVNGKRVLTKQFSPSVGNYRTHPFGGPGGVAEAFFYLAAK